jgi:hypothetical protein
LGNPAPETPFPDQVPPVGEKPVKENGDELEQVLAFEPGTTVGKALTV